MQDRPPYEWKQGRGLPLGKLSTMQPQNLATNCPPGLLQAPCRKTKPLRSPMYIEGVKD